AILNIVANTDEKLLTKENMLRIGESAGAGAVVGGMGAVPKGVIRGIRGEQDVSPPPVDGESTQEETVPTQANEETPNDDPRLQNAFNALAQGTKSELADIERQTIQNINAFAAAGNQDSSTNSAPVVEQSDPGMPIEAPIEQLPESASNDTLDYVPDYAQLEIDRLAEQERGRQNAQALGYKPLPPVQEVQPAKATPPVQEDVVIESKQAPVEVVDEKGVKDIPVAEAKTVPTQGQHSTNTKTVPTQGQDKAKDMPAVLDDSKNKPLVPPVKTPKANVEPKIDLSGDQETSNKNSSPETMEKTGDKETSLKNEQKDIAEFEPGQAVSWETKTKGIQSGTIIKQDGKHWRVKKDDSGRQTLVKNPFVKIPEVVDEVLPGQTDEVSPAQNVESEQPIQSVNELVKNDENVKVISPDNMILEEYSAQVYDGKIDFPILLNAKKTTIQQAISNYRASIDKQNKQIIKKDIDENIASKYMKLGVTAKKTVDETQKTLKPQAIKEKLEADAQKAEDSAVKMMVDEEVTDEYDGSNTQSNKKEPTNDTDDVRGRQPRKAEKRDDQGSHEVQSSPDVSGNEKVSTTSDVLEREGKRDDGSFSGRILKTSYVERGKHKRRGRSDSTNSKIGNGSEDGMGRNSRNILGFQRSDHTIKPGSIDREGGWKQAAENNLDAIELLKKINKEKRPATKKEQNILSKYVGWGASELANSMFPGYARYGRIDKYQVKPEWKSLVDRLDTAFTPEELRTAAKSTKYAHYTSEAIINSIYKALSRMGFDGGKILEPGTGVGNFIGLLPNKMRKNSVYTGIEMDVISAGIAKLLYPNQNIMNADFTTQKFPKNFFDAAIGNPPFGSIPILADPEYRKNRFKLHNFFFAKSIDRVKPGGFLVFVTSRYTMDSQADKARSYISDRADLLGAIRLPQTAFKKNAGTDVVTDVLFLQKREEGAAPGGKAWTGQKEIMLGDEKALINEYFVKHPAMVLGNHSMQGSMYAGNQYTVELAEGNIEDLFAKAVLKLPASIYKKIPDKTAAKYNERAIIERDFNPANKKEGGVYLNENGDLMKVDAGSGISIKDVHQTISKANMQLLKDYIPLRDALKLSHKAQLEDGDWKNALKALNKAYDAFVKKQGHIREFAYTTRTKINEDGTKEKFEVQTFKKEKIFLLDAEGVMISTLEKITDDGNIIKSNVLLSRTVNKPKKPTITSIPDALAVSLDMVGRLDVEHVAKTAGKSVEEVVGTLGDLIYEDSSEGHILADEYLSGNVVRKLEEARAAAKIDSKYERNVSALEKNQPEPLKPEHITITPGVPWIDVKYYGQFATEVLGMPPTIVTHQTLDNSWQVLPMPHSSRQYKPQGLRKDTDEWSTGYRGSNEIFEAVLNNRSIRITATIDKKTILNESATAGVNEIAKNLKARFNSWVWEDAKRARELLAIYNSKVNVIKGREFDGSHLTLPGMSEHFRPYDHQKRVVWRILQEGSSYLAHAVGSGKTFVMIAAGMEMRRLGMINKPLYIVPNHMISQFSQEFQELYPLANIMVAGKTNFHTDSRRRFVAQAALNDPDAIILTHSAFKLLKVREETLAPVRDDFLMMMREALSEMEDEDLPRMTIKRMEKRIENAEQRFAAMVTGGDNVVSFEELGADFLFVDEAHEFRKLDFVSNRQMKGIDQNGSQMAIDLYIKTLWLKGQNPGRSHVFASGTPITNTMGELYSLMRFFDNGFMEEDGISHFDAWASMFGEPASAYEMNSAGKFEMVERFARFVNVPELMSRVRSFMDVLTSQQLGERVIRPDIKNGAPEIVLAPKNPTLKAYQDDVLQPRINASRAWKPNPEQKGNPDPMINIITDGRLAAIDLRYVEPLSKNDPASKLNVFIDGIIDTYNENKDNKYKKTFGGTKDSDIPGGSIICFYNLGFGKAVAERRGFNGKAYLTGRLKKAGIPVSEIGWIDDYGTAPQKEALFKAIRTGKKKILLGSAKKMGTGVNAQNRLVASHYLDAPWYPADVEQPDGRILRQGNQNKIVDMRRYATEGSYDSTMWGMVARKARSIESAFMGDSSVRTIEDVSETSQYEMAAAMASGDERVVKLVELQAEIERLFLLSNAHGQTQRRLANDKDRHEYNIDQDSAWLEHFKDVEKKLPGYIGAKIAGKVGKSEYTERKLFGAALVKKLRATTKVDKGNKDREKRKILLGLMNGVNIYAKASIGAKSKLTEDGGFLYLLIEGQEFGIENSRFKVAGLDIIDAVGLTKKISNTINGLPSIKVRIENKLDDEKKTLSRVRKSLGSPFPHSKELSEKIEEATALEKELFDEGKEIPVSGRHSSIGAAGFDQQQFDDASLPGSNTVKFSTSDDKVQLPGQGVTLKDIQSRFKGQVVFISKDGHISIRLKNGHGLRIVNTNEIGKGDTQFAIQSGRMGKNGIILGKYVNSTITLNKDLASNFTLDHELGHFFIDTGMLTKNDLLTLDGKITGLSKKGEFRFKLGKNKEENRVNALAQLLEDRKKYRDTAIGRILQKIADFIDGLLHIGRISAGNVARKIESGDIFSRDVSQNDSEKGKFQTTVDLEYEQQEDTFFKKASDLFIGNIQHRKDKGKNYEEDVSAMAHIFKTTMYNAEKIGGAYKRLWNVIRKQNDHKSNAQRRLWYEGDHSLLESFKGFAQKNKAEYRKIKNYLTQRDIERKGFVVKKKGDEFELLHWKKEKGSRQKLGIYADKEKAWEDAILIEAEESGFSEKGQAALINFRTMSHNLYHHFAKNLEEAINAYEKAGQALPQIIIQNEDGSVSIDLRTAADRMGDLRGSYFPRLRNSGQWRVIGSKAGAAKKMQFFDTRRLPGGANTYRAELERKGYTTEIEKVGKLSEDLFSTLEPLLAQQQVLNSALKDMSNNDKQRVLEDANIKASWRDDVFVLSGSGVYSPEVEQAVKHLGGEFKEIFLRNLFKGEIVFENIVDQNHNEFEQKVTDAIIHSGGLEVDMDLAFANAMVKQYDIVLKGRGARSRMIARSDSMGIEVVQGYETDPVIAITSAMQAAAGSEAKAMVAKEGTATIAGRDVSWKEFKDRSESETIEALEKELKELNLSMPEDDAKKEQLKKDLTNIRQSLINAYGLSPNHIIKKQREIKKILDEMKSLTKWSDIKQAQDLKTQITQAKTGLYEEYLSFVDERKLNAKTQPKAYSEATAALKDILRNQEFADRVLGTLKGLAVWQYLGLRVSSAAVNVTNMGFAVPAAINGETDNQVPLRKALAHIARAMKNFTLHRAGKLDGDQKMVFDEIRVKGWDSPVFNREAFDVLSGRLGKGWSFALEKSMWLFGKAEELNRASTIAATYFSMKEKNQGSWDHDAMMEKAKDISDKAHGDYSKANRPFQMRGGNLAGQVLQASYVFHTFEHNYLQEMYRLGWDKKQYKAAAYMAFSPAIFGIGATLPIGIAKALSSVFGGGDPEEELIKLAESSFGMGDVARNGIMGIGDHGVDLKGSLATRFGVPNAFADIFGAPGSVVADWWEGGKNITKGHYQEGFEKILPAAVGNVLKGYRESTSGVTTRSGSPVFWGKEQIKGDSIDMILRMLSFNPTNISKKKEIQWSEYRTQARYRAKKSEIIKKFKSQMNIAIDKRNRHDILKIKADIRDFNAEIKNKKLTRFGLLITDKSLKDAKRRNVKAPKRERLRKISA
ncbi:MAG: PLxRFG domain-containing protein, partial [Desulfobacteraceae bacterium]|nr:PLxRFG domain-containing protein [Desulfobacteraceae bacterium]